MRRSSSLPWIVALVLASFASASRAEDPPPLTSPEAAERFLAALRAKDEATLAEIAKDPNVDYFLVANVWLERHTAAARGTDAAPREFIDAASALAERVRERKGYEGLPALVARWKALGPEDHARQTRIEAALARARTALRAKDWAEAAAEHARGLADLDLAPWSVDALLVRAVGAQALEATDDYAKSVDAWKAVQQAAVALGWTALRASAWKAVGRDETYRENFTAAAAAVEEARKIYESLGDPWGVAEALDELGFLNERVLPLDGAIDLYGRAAAAWEALGVPQAAAASTRRRARLVWVVGRLDEAITDFRKAVAVLEKGDDPSETAYAFQGLGDALMSAGRADEGIPALERALEIARTLPDHPSTAFLRGSLGNAQASVGRFADAIENLNAAREAHRQAKDRHGEASAIGNLGTTYVKMGHFDRGIALLDEARKAFESSGDRIYLATMLGNLGSALEHVGRYAEALSLLERAYAENTALGRKDAAAANLVNLGGLHHGLGDDVRAKEVLERALATLEAGGNRPFATSALGNLALVYAALGTPERAIDGHERALAARRAMGDRDGAATELGSLAGVHRDLGHLDRAVALYEEALGEKERLGDVAGVSVCAGNLALLYEDLGQDERASGTFDRALAAARLAGARSGEATILTNLARRAFRLGDFEGARASARIALELRLEEAKGLGDGAPEALLGERRDVVDLGIAAVARSLAAGTTERGAALEMATWFTEAGRGLQLSESLLNRRAILAAKAPIGVVEAHAAARIRVESAQKALDAAVAATPDDPLALRPRRDEMKAAYRALDDALARLEREARRVADVVVPRVASLAAIRASLPPGTALLEYHLAKEAAIALVVTAGGQDLVSLGDAKAIATRAEEYLGQAGRDGTDERALAAKLYDDLLRPVEKSLGGAQQLLVAGDDVLAFLPFEALVRVEGERRERAIERFEIEYVPSGSVRLALLANAKPSPAPTALLALGDPVYPPRATPAAPGPMVSGPAIADAGVRGMGDLRPLPGTRAEVEALARLFAERPHAVLLGERATVASLEAAVAESGRRLGAFHLACHGHVDASRPWLSGLVLSGGEVLSLDQIYRMELPADLVVLSACRTARGKTLRGEGVMGLVRGFFFAGAPRVVVSDWQVSDESTKDLMVSFYRRMLADGTSPGAALRGAKLEMLRAGGPRSHPFHWAPFVLWGLPE